jgi:hypothetical protein
VPSTNVNTTDTIEGFRTKVNTHFNDTGEHGGGSGVPAGGAAAGMFIAKDSATDFDVDWWELVAGSNISVSPNTTLKEITIAALGSGDGVIAGKVDTIAALRGASSAGLATGDLLIVGGYYALGDKACYEGSPMWYRVLSSSSLVDNGGSIIKPTDAATPGKRFIRMQDNMINVVTQFGARGMDYANPSTQADDAPFFIAAAQALGTSPSNPSGNYGGLIMVPPGSYPFDTTADFGDTIHRTEIRGAGGYATSEGIATPPNVNIRLRNNIDAFAVRRDYTMVGSGDIKHSGWKISNINFRNLTGTVRQGRCIVTRLINRGTVERCTHYDVNEFFVNLSEQSGYGIKSSSPVTEGDASWWDITHCHGWKSKRHVYVPHSGNVNVDGGSHYGPGPDITGTRCVTIEGGNFHRVHDFKAEECEIGIEMAGGASSIHDIVSEDCGTVVWCKQNSGTASGTNVLIDGIYAGCYLPEANYGIRVDSGVSGVLGPRRGSAGSNLVNMVLNQSSSFRVAAKPSAATYTGD